MGWVLILKINKTETCDLLESGLLMASNVVVI